MKDHFIFRHPQFGLLNAYRMDAVAGFDRQWMFLAKDVFRALGFKPSSIYFSLARVSESEQVHTYISDHSYRQFLLTVRGVAECISNTRKKNGTFLAEWLEDCVFPVLGEEAANDFADAMVKDFIGKKKEKPAKEPKKPVYDPVDLMRSGDVVDAEEPTASCDPKFAATKFVAKVFEPTLAALDKVKVHKQPMPKVKKITLYMVEEYVDEVPAIAKEV